MYLPGRCPGELAEQTADHSQGESLGAAADGWANSASGSFPGRQGMVKRKAGRKPGCLACFRIVF